MLAPLIQPDNVYAGYDYIIEVLKAQNINEAEGELEMCKALMYLKDKDFENAIHVLKGFELKDKNLRGRAATNISFIYLLEQDYKQAEQYADMAIKEDRQNALALVNKGNCFYFKEEFEKAKEHQLEAIGVEADCLEAIYNLGLVNKPLNLWHEAIQAFEKIQSVVFNAPEVL